MLGELAPSFPEALADNLFGAFDRDRSSGLDLDEFLSGMAVLLKGKAEERLKLVFDICDVDHSGRLSHDELRQYLLLVGQVYPSEATNSDPVSAGLKSLLPAASLRG